MSARGRSASERARILPATNTKNGAPVKKRRLIKISYVVFCHTLMAAVP